MTARVLAVFAIAIAAQACKGAPNAGESNDAAASPQAQAEPAPLATPTVSGAPTTPSPDAGPPPTPMRADREVAVDTPREMLREPGRDASAGAAKEPKDLTGYTLTAVLRASDVAGAPKAPEVNEKALDLARRKTEPRLTIDLSQTRARIVIASSGFVLPPETEIRARVDRYGYIMVWPHESTYRVIEPGALRALFGERRTDVAPLSIAEIAPSGDAPHRQGLRVRKVEVTTRAAKASFEIATLKDAGEGGTLLCRALLDLMNAAPTTPLCATDEAPVHAELRWTTRGTFVFDVVSVARRADLALAQLAAPPPQLAFAQAPPPPASFEMLLSRAELAALRTNAIDVPATSPSDAATPAPDSGLALVNSTDVLRFAFVDGVPVAWLAPGARVELGALLRGRYVVQWRTFLGDALEPPQLLVVPGKSDVGGADAGPLGR